MMTCSRCGPDVAEKYVDFFNGQGIFTPHELKDQLKLSMDGTGFKWPDEKKMTNQHQRQINTALRSWSDVYEDFHKIFGAVAALFGTSLFVAVRASLAPMVCTHMPAAVSGLLATASVCPSES